MKLEEIKYVITQEQYDDLCHFNRMFRHNAESLKELCKEERSDINIGFELGYINKHLWECFSDMQHEIESIHEQDFELIFKKINKKSKIATNKDI